MDFRALTFRTLATRWCAAPPCAVLLSSHAMSLENGHRYTTSLVGVWDIGPGRFRGYDQRMSSGHSASTPSLLPSSHAGAATRQLPPLAIPRRPPSRLFRNEFDLQSCHLEHQATWWDREVRKLAPAYQAPSHLPPLRDPRSDPLALFILRKNKKRFEKIPMPPLDL